MVRGNERSLMVAMIGVALAAMLAALAGIDARATYGARVTADEPQYLLTAISLGEDRSLDVSDELAAERFLPFHEIALNPQTIELDDEGRRVSPHDPLLPVVLAVPMLIGGWFAAKLTLVACAGAVAALTLRLAVRRLDAPLGPASVVVGAFAMAPPLSVYGVQVYPAMPAALCVLLGVLAASAPIDGGPAGRRVDRSAALIVVVVIALPWLSVKYVPVAAVLAAAGLGRGWRRDRRVPVGTLAIYAAAGISYLALHRWLYGGWTVYAAGDHFVDGEFLVVGADPDYVARSRRLIGLLVDRGFGLIAWNPGFIALPPALVAVARSRQPVRVVLLAAFAATWATATWVALTMHGWWWPGRQVVPVVPLAVAAIAALVGRHRGPLVAVVGGAVLGVVSWLVLAWESSTGRRTLVVDFEATVGPWYRLWRPVLPDHRRMEVVDVALTIGWGALLVALCVVAARRERPPAQSAISGRSDSGVDPTAPTDPVDPAHPVGTARSAPAR